MADVARVAGVSVTTVSHVINRTRNVAPETAEVVLGAVAKTGYRHNLAARALATSSTTTIGLAMSIVTNPYFGALAHSLEERFRQAGFSLVLANTNDDPVQALDVIEDLQARRVSGIIAVPLEGSPELTATFNHLVAARFPLVFLDRRSEIEVDQVYSENEGPVYELTTHLAELGHRRIGLVTGTSETMSAKDRLTGYTRAVTELGLDADPSLVISGESDESVAHTEVRRHLESHARATALVVANNQMAIGALRAVRDSGLKVPRDIAIASFDDFEGADLLDPGLTVVRQDTATLASSAVSLLLRRITNPSRQARTVTVPTTLEHRGSCGCGRKRYRQLSG
ncbi:LacI family DNA-binding transcriptional regulator [Georgenia subflava]|nr:LacI family DNA-binding transcriptional regulator [Georgenia subflava]